MYQRTETALYTLSKSKVKQKSLYHLGDVLLQRITIEKIGL